MFALLVSMTTAVAVAPSPANAQAGGFQTSGTQLLDANGNPFVARGTSVPHVWYTQNSPAQFNDVAGLGANTVRVVLGSGQHADGPWGPSLDVGNVIGWCKQNAMICMLEIHDATGFGEAGGAVSIIDVINSYWANPTVMNAVQGEEAYVLVNIANEPRGNNNAGAWVQETQQAIQMMRDLGYDHTLVVDAPNWGQDWQFNMRDNAVAVANSDPQDNTLFSIHMYEVFSSAANVTAYFDAFQQMGLPLVVGEFGWVHNGQNVAFQTVMSEAQARGIGWWAWSWSGNSGGAEQLDQSNGFNPDSLTQWGQDVFNGPNGIAQTAQCATVFPDCGGQPQEDPPGQPGAPSASNVGQTSFTLSWGASNNNPTSYQVVQQPGGQVLATVSGNPPATSVQVTGLQPDNAYQVAVRASNSAGTSPLSTSASVTTLAGDPTGDCQVSYGASNWGGHPGFTASVTITNTGSQAINGWSLVWDYPAGQTVNDYWGSTITQSGSTVTAANVGWNGTIPPNGSTNFGFNGLATSAGNNPAPTAFSLNGTNCSVG
jgi:mannan endo-1,4-beta-mannosidase